MGPGHLFDLDGWREAAGLGGSPGGSSVVINWSTIDWTRFFTNFYDNIDWNDFWANQVDWTEFFSAFYDNIDWNDFFTEFNSNGGLNEVIPGTDNQILQVDAATDVWVARSYFDGPLHVGNPVSGNVNSYLQLHYDASGDMLDLRPPGINDNVMSVYQSSGSGQDLRFRLICDNGSNGAALYGWDPTGLNQTFEIRNGRLQVLGVTDVGGAPAPNCYYDSTTGIFYTTTGGSSGGGTATYTGLFVAIGQLSVIGLNTVALSPAIPSGKRLLVPATSSVVYHCAQVAGGGAGACTLKIGSDAGHQNVRTAQVVNLLTQYNKSDGGSTATQSVTGTLTAECTVASGGTTHLIDIMVWGYLVDG